MSRLLPCLLCGLEGREGRDVTFRLFEFEDGDRRDVEVRVPVSHRKDAVEVALKVPERYASIPRCLDVKACAERVAEAELVALAAAAPPAPTVESEDPMAWL